MKNTRLSVKLIFIVLGIVLTACSTEDPLPDEIHLKSAKTGPIVNSGGISDYILMTIPVIEELAETGYINNGVSTSLVKLIEEVVAGIERNNRKTAASHLKVFITQVNKLKEKGAVPVHMAQDLVNRAGNGLTLIKGSFTDIRDGNRYAVVLIGEQIWMAENLAYTGEPYPGVADYEENYGLLKNAPSYTTWEDWAIAPDGWHVPDDGEWQQLERTIGMTSEQANQMDWRGTDEGYKLKSSGEWLNGGNGSNEYGFSALPGGYIFDVTSEYGAFGTDGFYWTATMVSDEYPQSYYYRRFSSGSNQIYRGISSHRGLLSIRCVMD